MTRRARFHLTLSLMFLTAGVALALVAVLAPYLGLGLKVEFILYQWFGLSRTHAVLLALLFVALGAALPLQLVARFAVSRFPEGVLRRRAARAATALRASLALGPRARRPVFDRSDLIALLATSALMQGLYLAMTKISFECDALTFLQFAQMLSGQGGAYLPYRGPGFPIFLVLTGQTLFDTLYGTIFVHALLGIATPTLVYLTLRPIGRALGLAAAALLIVSSVPFTYAKVMIAQQLFMFLVVATAYCFSRFHFTRDPRFIYATLVLSLLATLTRGEGLPLIFVLGCVMLFVVLKDRANLRHLILAGATVVGLFLGYSGVRSAALGDPSLFASLSNWGGRQLFLQPYTIQKPKVVRIRQSLLGTMNQGDPTPRLVRPENGPASRRFFELIAELYSDPKSYSHLEPLLTPESAGITSTGSEMPDVYHDLFGRFAGRPDALARNVFENPSQVYFDNLWRLIDDRIGMARSNTLFQRVSFEAIRQNPDILLAFAHNAFWYLGIDLLSVLEGKATLDATLRQIGIWFEATERGVREKGGVVRNHVFDMYVYPRFNIADCARSGQPSAMFAGYKNDFRKDRGTALRATLQVLQTARVVVLFAAGVTALALFWVLLFSEHRAFWLGIGPSALSMLAIVAVANTPSAKYDPGLQPLLIMAACAAAFAAARSLRNRQLRKRSV